MQPLSPDIPRIKVNFTEMQKKSFKINSPTDRNIRSEVNSKLKTTSIDVRNPFEFEDMRFSDDESEKAGTKTKKRQKTKK